MLCVDFQSYLLGVICGEIKSYPIQEGATWEDSVIFCLLFALSVLHPIVSSYPSVRSFSLSIISNLNLHDPPFGSSAPPPDSWWIPFIVCTGFEQLPVSVCLSGCLSVCQTIYMTVRLSALCLAVFLYMCLSICMSSHNPILLLYTCLSVCIFVYMSICLSALCLSFYVPVCLYVRVSTCLLSVSAPDCLSASVSVSLSLRLSLYVSLRMSVCLYLHPFFRFTNLSSRVRPLRIPSFPSLIPLYLLLQPLPPLPPLEPSQPPLRSFALRSTGSPRPVNRLSCAQLPSTVKPIEDLIFDPRCT